MMTDLVSSEYHLRPRTLRPFVERCCFLRTYVLPAEVHDATPLSEEFVTSEAPTSSRDLASADGLCFVQVEYTFAPGLYWARVAATPKFSHDEHVLLTEEHLLYALAYDVRLYWRKPAEILYIMQEHARELAPLQPHTENAPVADLLPGTLVEISIERDKAGQRNSVEVAEDDLLEALGLGHPETKSTAESRVQETSPRTRTKLMCKRIPQQGLLHVMLKALRRLAQICKQAIAIVLKAWCELVVRMQRWHRRNHLRVIYVERSWCAMRQCWIWHLTLWIPKSLLVEPAAQAAAA